MNVRKIVLELLLRAEEEKKYVNLTVPAAASEWKEEDRRFLSALLYGTVEKKITLDYWIGRLAERDPDRMEPYTKNLLRTGIYQLVFMEKVPAFAAVNEAVKLARNAGEAAFVNAILRRVGREKDSLPYPPRGKNLYRYLSVRYSFPLPLVRHFAELLGDDACERFLIASSEIPPLSIRVNTLKISVQELFSLYSEQGILCSLDENSPYGLKIYDKIPVSRLPGYTEGYFFVQDTASQLECLALAPKENSLIVDVCACPGGKSFSAAIQAKDNCRVIAIDLHASKMSLVQNGAKRLGIHSVECVVGDARLPIPSLLDQANYVICDVPCSGLGVLSKKPDLRYRELQFEELTELQYAILHTASAYVREGGVLVYSTCTLNPAENEAQVQRFLATHREYYPADFGYGELRSHLGMLTLYPHIHHTDGFFITKLVKGKQ